MVEILIVPQMVFIISKMDVILILMMTILEVMMISDVDEDDILTSAVKDGLSGWLKDSSDE